MNLSKSVLLIISFLIAISKLANAEINHTCPKKRLYDPRMRNQTFVAEFESENFIMCVEKENPLQVDLSYIQTINESLEQSYRVIVGNWQMKEPSALKKDSENSYSIAAKFPVFIIDTGKENARTPSTGDLIEISHKLPVEPYNKRILTPAHEFFHLVQMEYATLFDPIFSEGTARWVEDKIGREWNVQNRYLEKDDLLEHPWYLINFNYPFAIFWNYFGEQLSANPDLQAVDRGWEPIKKYFENIEYLSNINTIRSLQNILPYIALETTIQELSKGRYTSLNYFYRQFLTALYARGIPNTDKAFQFQEYHDLTWGKLNPTREYVIQHSQHISLDNVRYYDPQYMEDEKHFRKDFKGFVSFGLAEFHRFHIDSKISRMNFSPEIKKGNDNIFYQLVLNYERKMNPIESVAINETQPTTYELKGKTQDLAEVVLIVFTLDPNPIDGFGNTYKMEIQFEEERREEVMHNHDVRY
jgi:hypothetical protein